MRRYTIALAIIVSSSLLVIPVLAQAQGQQANNNVPLIPFESVPNFLKSLGWEINLTLS